jgi:SAM-dependent methyltransferase
MPVINTRKTLLRACPVCGGGAGEILHTQHFAVMDDYPLPSVYDVVICSDCAFVFADTPATQADYDRYYATCSIYQDASVASGGGIEAWDARRLAKSVEIMSRLLQSTDSSILDVGCANGGLLQAFRSAGYHRVVGVDPSAVCVANTKAKRIEAHRGELSRLPVDIGKFDLVILASVLEHVLDVKEALAALVSVCAPGGRIFLEVPDAAAYANYLYAPFQDFNTEHINHFSMAALDNVLAQFGFSRCLEERFLMDVSPTIGSPSLEVAYERQSGASTGGGWKVDADFRTSIERYIAESRGFMQRLDCQLGAAVTRSSEYILWGTGQLAMKLLCDTVLKDARLLACIDGNSVNFGRQLKGVPILPPERIPSQDVPIIITTLMHADEIRSRIQALGLKNPIVSLAA